MASKNIYDTDDWLQAGGWIVLVPTALGGLVYLPGKYGHGPSFWLALLVFCALLLSAFGMWVAAWLIHRDEKRIISLWDIFAENSEVDLRELYTSTSFTAADVKHALPLINRQPGAYFVLDERSGRVVDGRLRARSRISNHCPSCGAAFSLEVLADLSEGSHCPYCHAGLDISPLVQQKVQLLTQLRRGADHSRHITQGPAVSVPLFLFLIFFFPPLAVGYLIFVMYKKLHHEAEQNHTAQDSAR